VNEEDFCLPLPPTLKMNSELQEALELAQVYGCVVVESSDSSLTVCFNNDEIAKTYTRRVNQATVTLIAERDNLCVTVEERF
jgi:hypothetical protein